MVRVKICGITNLDDARAALAAGADYLGFILYPPSPRAVAPDEVASIVAQLRATQSERLAGAVPCFVGVFVNEAAAHMAGLLDRCGLDLAQLSGDENESLITDHASPLFGRAYKAIRPKSPDEANTLSIRYAKNNTPINPLAPRLLLDTPHQSLYGGTGQIGDWSLAAELAGNLPGLMLAGGLNPMNVAQAVREVRPFAVDVAGGVEARPGRKDHVLVREFITQAKALR